MIYHIVTGDMAAAQLQQAIALSPEMAGEIVVIKDVLNVGPIKKDEGQKFSELRTAFWQQIVLNEKNPIQVDDLDRLLRTANELSKNESPIIWIWIAPLPADLCTYFWSLRYLGKYLGRVFVVNLAGLPFLDEQGKLFYPQSISSIQPKELVKARRLARLVTATELEMDGEDWQRLTAENGGIRVREAGKKMVSKSDTFYDHQLIACCTDQFQKASRIISQVIAKYDTPTGDLYLGWRLRELVILDTLELQGDVSRGLRDFDVKIKAG